MANDYSASLQISTSEAQHGVKELDGAVGNLDSTLKRLDKTMKDNQGNLDAVVGKMSELTKANAALIRSETDRARATQAAAKADREKIINEGKISDAINKTAESKAKVARIEGQTSNAGNSSTAANARRDAESTVRTAGLTAVANARVATENERGAGAAANAAAATIRQGSAAERAAAQTDRLASSSASAANGSLALTDSLSNSRYLLYDVGQTYTVLSAALLAIPTATAAVAIAYERDFAQVMRTNAELGAGGVQGFAPLRQELKDLATQIPLTFGELSKISTIGGQLNIGGGQIGAFTETVAKFGAASNVGLEEAATAFGRFQQSFKEGKTDPDFFNKLGSAIAYVGVKSAATETEIIAVSNQISAAGSQFGFTAEQVVGLSGALASVRIRPELARGAFQRIMLGLSRAADEGAGSFNKFAKYTGVAGQAAIDLFKKDPSEFFHKYIGGVKGAIDATGSVSGVLDDIGAKSVFDKQFILGLANGYSTYTDALQNSNKAYGEGSFLTKSTAVIFETLDAKIKRITSSVMNLGDTLGSGSLASGKGALATLADTILNVVNAADRFAKATPGFAGFVGAAMALGGAIGVLLAFKAAQAFVLAGLVGFQQVLGKTSIAAGLTLKGNLQELAKTLLMTKGVTAEAAAGFIQANGTMKAFAATATMSRVELLALNTAAETTGNTVTRNTGRAAGFGGALKGIGSAALGLVGGPAGALLLILGSIGLKFVEAEEKANSAGDAIARAMTSGAEAGKRGIGEELLKRTVDSAPGGDSAGGLGNHGKNVQELAKQVGISFDSIVNSISKGKDASADFNNVLNEYSRNKGFKDFADLQDKSLTNLQNSKGELQFIAGLVEKYGNSYAKAADGQKAVAKAAGEVTDATGKAVPTVDEFGNKLGDTGTQAKDAASSLDDYLKAVFGIVDAQGATQAALSSLGEGLAKSSDFGPNSAGGRDNVKSFQDAIRAAAIEQQQLISQTGKGTQQATADYVAFVDGLVQEMATRGVDPAQVQTLADNAKNALAASLNNGEAPKVPVGVNEAKAVEQATALPFTVQAYLDQIQPPTMGLVLNTDEPQQKLIGLAQSLAQITGLPYLVVLDALTNPANEKAAEVNAVLNAITNGTYVAPVGADTSAAITNVQNFSSYARQELANLQAAYNNVLRLSSQGQGFLKGASNLALGKQFDGGGAQTYFGPNMNAPVSVAPAQKAPPVLPTANPGNLGGVADGYNKARDAAKGAGDAGKQAGKDMANGIDDATKATEDYANRLKTGLTSAFDKQYGLQKATDEYHSALNAIKKKRDEELKQMDDLVQKQKELNNERNKNLTDARKAGIEKNISLKYGEVDRAADYAKQEQTALDAAAAKQKDIVANNAQIISLRAGIDNFKGYSDAAIANREALRNLESKMLDMVVAYAATGASQEQVRAYAQRLTEQFKVDAGQIWVNRVATAALTGELSRYVTVINSVPRVKATTVTANTGQATGALQGVADQMGRVGQGVAIPVSADTTLFEQQMARVWANLKRTFKDPLGTGSAETGGGRANGWMGGGMYQGGQVPGFASGGKIPGRAPANPGVDNLMANVDGKGMIKVRSGEFIVQQPAVDYWGGDFMNAINNMKMPQFNSGGSVGGSGGGSGSGGPLLVELTAENIAAILRAADRPINLLTEDRVIAESASRGNTILASTGSR